MSCQKHKNVESVIQVFTLLHFELLTDTFAVKRLHTYHVVF